MHVDEAFKMIAKMAALQRYSQIKLVCEESVLEHTGFVCMFSYLLGSAEGLSSKDMGELLSRAVVHDIDEIVTGDIPRPTKYHNKAITAAIADVERENMLAIANSVSGHVENGEKMFNQWSNAKEGHVGIIVAIADIIAVAYKAWHEHVMYGNASILETLQPIEDSLDACIKKVSHFYGDKSVLIEIINEVKLNLEKCK